MIPILNSYRVKVGSSIFVPCERIMDFILGGEVVEVDESLFEDMLDLELDEAGTTGIDLSDVDQ